MCDTGSPMSVSHERLRSAAADPDEELVEQARKAPEGDLRAFEKLVLLHQRRVVANSRFKPRRSKWQKQSVTGNSPPWFWIQCPAPSGFHSFSAIWMVYRTKRYLNLSVSVSPRRRCASSADVKNSGNDTSRCRLKARQQVEDDRRRRSGSGGADRRVGEL